MPTYDWRGLLTQLSSDLLASDEFRDEVPPEVVAAGWLGYPGATEEQIAAAEARLGTRFPPSYREFLAVTNGWRITGPFIDRLWSTDDIEWFRVRHQGDWIDPWIEGQGGPSTVPDAEYFVYGDEQNETALRTAYLSTALEISDIGDDAVYLLNPQIVTPEGEWEAWLLASWLPGARRYRSFWEMMRKEREDALTTS